MKALVQNYLGYTPYNPATQYALLYYMSGSVPTTPAQVNAAVDLSDTSDLHSKCVGACLTTVTYAQDTTGVGSFSGSYVQAYNPSFNWSWLKGGSIKNGSWYFLPPSRAYYENGRKANLYTLPPTMFTMPCSPIYGSVNTSYNVGVHYSDTPAMSASFILEYDQATTVSALFYGHGDPWYGSTIQYPLIQAVYLYYWDTTSSSYLLAYSYDPGVNYAEIAGLNGFSFTAVTSTKFKVVMYGHRGLGLGQYCFNTNGFCLSHSSPPATVSVPNITWGVFVPYQVGLSVGSSTVSYCGLYDIDTSNVTSYNNITSVLQSNYDVTRNLNTGRSAMWYGIAAKNMPAIIDNCGQDSTANKIVITKSTSLSSTDQPLLSSYKYIAGDFI